MKKFKVDLHTHTSNFSHLIFNKPNKKKYLLSLLDGLFKKKGNLVMGIADANGDGRYKKFVDLVGKYGVWYGIDMKYKDYFISVSKGKKRIYFVKCDEIGTNKGHVLIVGHRGKIGSRKLGDVLKEAHRSKCLIFANHTLHVFGVDYFIVSKLLGIKKPLSMSKKDLERNIKGFDAIELNSYFPEDWKKIRRISGRAGKKVTTSSDAHFLGEFFRSYIELEGLNFDNPKKFKRSLRKAFKKSVGIHARKHGFVALYRHAFQVLFDHFFAELGLMRKG